MPSRASTTQRERYARPRVVPRGRGHTRVRLRRDRAPLEDAETVLLSLAQRIEARDPYTLGHCKRLSVYARALGECLGLPEADLQVLARAAAVHDVGKIAVPDAVLLKAGPLDDAEWLVMRRHPVVGEGICRNLDCLRQVLPLIRAHHERRDGSGYPDGLVGDQIPLGARVLQVVDVYDALRTARPYKRALGCEVALTTLREEVERGWWDPTVVAAFEELVRRRKAGLGRG